MSKDDHQRVAEYLTEAPREVADDWAWVRDFLKKSDTAQLRPMPAGLEERLNRLYSVEASTPLADKVSDWMGSIRRVVAELVDPGIEPSFAASGLRSKSFEDSPRQWTFTTGQFEIWINALSRPDERFDLHGQIYPVTGATMPKGHSVQLVREERDSGLATVDDYGEFLIQQVPAGDYELIVAGEDTEVVCSPVTFGA